MLKGLFKVNFKWLEVVFFAGAAAGAVVGSVAGIGIGYALGNLFAEKTGEDLRSEIAEKTTDFAETVKEKGKKLRQKTNELYAGFSDNGEGSESET